MMSSNSALASVLNGHYGITEEQRTDPVVCGDHCLLFHEPAEMLDKQMQRSVRKYGTMASAEQLAVGMFSGYEDYPYGQSLRIWKTGPYMQPVLLARAERDAFVVRRLQHYMEQLPSQQSLAVRHIARHIGRNKPAFHAAFPQHSYQQQPLPPQSVPVNTGTTDQVPASNLPAAGPVGQAELIGHARQQTGVRVFGLFGQRTGMTNPLHQGVPTSPEPSLQGAAPSNYGEQNKLASYGQREGALCKEDKQNCEKVLGQLMAYPHALIVFNTPVDPVKWELPDYFDVIKSPMDLGTIQTKLKADIYHSVEDFKADIMLTFNNALMYNQQGSDVANLAQEMKEEFESLVHLTNRSIHSHTS